MQVRALDALLPRPAVHLISLRHPLFWNNPWASCHRNFFDPKLSFDESKQYHAIWCLLAWLDVWGETMAKVAEKQIPNVFLVRFESELLALNVTEKELGEAVRGSCVEGKRPRRRSLRTPENDGGRELELKGNGGAVTLMKFLWEREYLQRLTACDENAACKRCISLAESAANALGYTLKNHHHPLLPPSSSSSSNADAETSAVISLDFAKAEKWGKMLKDASLALTEARCHRLVQSNVNNLP